MRRYVVDASVILKWVLGDERESDQDKVGSPEYMGGRPLRVACAKPLGIRGRQLPGQAIPGPGRREDEPDSRSEITWHPSDRKYAPALF